MSFSLWRGVVVVAVRNLNGVPASSSLPFLASVGVLDDPDEQINCL
jgi:hypothetical protein